MGPMARAVPVLLAWLSVAAGHDDIERLGRQAQVTSGEKKCGVTESTSENGTMDLNPPLHVLECNQIMSTNCSMTYYPMECPEECPYIVPSGAFSCLFKCMKKEECSAFNPDRAYPNSKTMICMPCLVSGCKLCSDHNVCTECHPDFSLLDGACELSVDKSGVAAKIVQVVGYLIIGLILLALVWYCINGKNENWEANMFAINRARRHRRLVKVLNWDMSSKRVASRFALGTNMTSNNIRGLGLCLFHNTLKFTVFVSVLFYAVSSVTYSMAGVESALSRFEYGPDGLMANAVMVEDGAPAMVISRLMVCSEDVQTELHASIKGFAHKNFIGLGVLYVSFFYMLYRFTLFQKEYTEGFGKEHVVMADYALRVTGLPENETDEETLMKWLQDEFRKVLPDKYGRAEIVTDGGPYMADTKKYVDDSQIEVKGISLCYDYTERWGEVDDMIQGLMMRIELESADLARKAGGSRQMNADDVGGLATVTAHEQTYHREAEAWFKPSSEKEDLKETDPLWQRMKTIGEAFVVFQYTEDAIKVLEHFEKNRTSLTYPGAEEPLKLCKVITEPPSINWWHLGVKEGARDKNIVLGLAKIVCMIAIVQGCVVYPFVKYILWPYSRVGSQAGGMSMSVLGVVIGNLNMFISIQLWMTSFGMGFRRKESMDTLVLFGNTALNMGNNMVNVAVTVLTVFSAASNTEGFDMLVSPITMLSAGTETQLAKGLYQMLMPGFFFVGFLMTIVMAGIWPYLFNTFLMKLIYVWAALPSPLLKVIKVFLPWAPDRIDKYVYWRAERALEPMEIQIGDYSNLILITFICSLVLFTMSPYTHKLFLCMLAWSVFYYFFMQYMHLRFCKAAFYTTNRIDIQVNVLWGLPLSVVASAWCQWGIRARVFAGDWTPAARYGLLPVAFLLSFALWNLVYWKVVKPGELKEGDEDEKLNADQVKARTFYSWFNCNPVFVLKCAYYFQDENGESIKERRGDHPIASGEDPNKVRFYTVGKEYLFLKPERQDVAFEVCKGGEGYWMEIEAYCEALLGFLDEVAGIFGRGEKKVENRSMNKIATDEQATSPLLQGDSNPEATTSPLLQATP